MIVGIHSREMIFGESHEEKQLTNIRAAGMTKT